MKNLKRISFKTAMELSAANSESPCEFCLEELAACVKAKRHTLFRVEGDRSWHVFATKKAALHNSL